MENGKWLGKQKIEIRDLISYFLFLLSVFLTDFCSPLTVSNFLLLLSDFSQLETHESFDLDIFPQGGRRALDKFSNH